MELLVHQQRVWLGAQVGLVGAAKFVSALRGSDMLPCTLSLLLNSRAISALL